ncbi:GTP-binding protein [Saccharospirillum sp. MSK14-1]|uniref:Rab family GTPase n=1 Tax=Saccharospirillum sp. MSK14-1 TaxID=1897632 RepID=UPI000D3BA9D7|nr:Rab family GTPase [Saccharospirillum sp. MSK14-1]PTY35753.1 GTP-binding protein [Saccharospirillum sp. MSK14-1]
MIQKKICLLGGFSVGKTSLIKRYVSSIFDDKYLTTVGVKIDKKQVAVDDKTVNLMIWDLAGEDDFCKLKASYLRGASGYILVIDPTRPNTLETALKMHDKSVSVLGDVPVIVALNKYDLYDDWLLTDQHFEQLNQLNLPLLNTSAKNGDAVETLFTQLSKNMLG